MDYLLICYLLVFSTSLVCGQDPPCSARDQCSCVTPDNKVIDLTSLGNTDGTPKFTDMQATDGYMYSYNPCVGFTELACTDQAVCQIPPDRTTSYPAGDAVSAVFSNDGLNNHIQYSSTDSSGTTRTSDVTLVCDPSADTPTLLALGEQGSSIYYLTLTTKCACADGCANSPPPGPGKKDDGGSSGISIGSVLCICVVGIGGVYLIGGLVFMKFVRQASGTDMIPNKTFWTAVPGSIKGGFQYTYCKIRGQQYSAYSSV